MTFGQETLKFHNKLQKTGNKQYLREKPDKTDTRCIKYDIKYDIKYEIMALSSCEGRVSVTSAILY